MSPSPELTPQRFVYPDSNSIGIEHLGERKFMFSEVLVFCNNTEVLCVHTIVLLCKFVWVMIAYQCFSSPCREFYDWPAYCL